MRMPKKDICEKVLLFLDSAILGNRKRRKFTLFRLCKLRATLLLFLLFVIFLVM